MYSYDSICKSCGRQIVYGHNGCMLSEYCTDCKPIRYYAKPRKYEESASTSIMSEQDWDAIDYMESAFADNAD